METRNTNTKQYSPRTGGSRSSGFRRPGTGSSGRSFSGGRSFGGGRSRFQGRRSGGGSSRFGGAKINPERYIAKAIESEIPEMYESSYGFRDLDLNESLKQNIIRRYKNPTKIQDQAIPHIIAGKDILGLASTGSGKTAAFLIPLIDKVLRGGNQKCLTIVPTRDLAFQIQEEFNQFVRGTNLKSTLVIGGASMSKQIYTLRQNPQFIFGTPGRLKDLNNRNVLNLNYFNNIVLDEVDRMLDMGFIEDIRFLISKMSQQKQSLFFSATMNRQAEDIANTLLVNPVRVQVAVQSPGKNVDQDIIRVKSENEKVEKLHDLLIQEGVNKVLVFTRTKRGADRVNYDLQDRGFKVAAIHGDKTQSKRQRVISDFQNNKLQVLVATDVASRGLDIKDITHVINYDEPENFETYIHRIGRTGRIGKKGIALTFVK